MLYLAECGHVPARIHLLTNKNAPPGSFEGTWATRKWQPLTLAKYWPNAKVVLLNTHLNLVEICLTL